jgi:hypothetical protein
MNATAVKMRRREVRRALGEDATRALEELTRELRQHQVVQVGQAEALRDVQGDVRMLTHEVHAFRHRPFWRRFGWLVRGR